MLRKRIHKSLFLVCVTVLCFAVLAFTGAVQYVAALASSSIYVALHYPARSLEFESAGYISVMDVYGVTFKDKEDNGPGLGLWMTPKEFPVFVYHDSIKGEA